MSETIKWFSGNMLIAVSLMLVYVTWSLYREVHRHYKNKVHKLTYITYRDYVEFNISVGVLKQCSREEVLSLFRRALASKGMSITPAASKQLHDWIMKEVREGAEYVQGCLGHLKDPTAYRTGYRFTLIAKPQGTIVGVDEIPHHTGDVDYGCSSGYAARLIVRCLLSLLKGIGPYSPYLAESCAVGHNGCPVPTKAMLQYHALRVAGVVVFGGTLLGVALTWLSYGHWWAFALIALLAVAMTQHRGENIHCRIADHYDDHWFYSRLPETDVFLDSVKHSRETSQRFVYVLVALVGLVFATVATFGEPIATPGVIGVILTVIVFTGALAGAVTCYENFLKATTRLDRRQFARRLGIEDSAVVF